MSKTKTKIFFSISLIAVFIGMVWIRAFVGSMKAHEQAEHYVSSGDLIDAMTFYDRSIRWYTPLNPYVQKSIQRLWDMGVTAETQGDSLLALMAFRTIRRGLYAASGLTIPGEDWIEKCDSKIQGLLAVEQTEAKLAMKGDRSPVGEAPGPHRLWSIVVTCAFLGWLGSVVGFIVFGLDSHGRGNMLWHRKVCWGASTVVFFTVWIIAMMKA